MLLKKKEELEIAAMAPAGAAQAGVPVETPMRMAIQQNAAPVSAPVQRTEAPPAVVPTVMAPARGALMRKREVANENNPDDQMTPAVWLNEVFMEAVRLEASDIHIIPEKEYLSVKFRVSGVITEVARWDIDYHDMIMSRIKVISGLQVVEKNIPQDGHLELLFELPAHETANQESVKEFNFRVSTMPTINGEAAVLRALNKEGSLLSLEEVGLSEKALIIMKKILRRGHGVVLMTGHSGSGKTTTLYSVLNYLNTTDKAILTIEDPVEYRVANIRQSQVNPATGYTFSVGLKALLRQDPDVIMIGEIRDEETAGIAMRLALVGRLVLTTLHTNSISGALVRMTDMDIGKSIVASAFIGIIAERLVRKICDKCRVESVPPYELLKMFDIQWPEGVKVYAGQGCDACNQSGYKGRLGIFEVLEIDEEFRNLIIQNVPGSVLDEYVKTHVVETLRDDGFDKVRRGITTLEEVIQVTI
jgi:type II secretory ATPase GspE/PulE/Tfp pilus assembly ATPase PilB-like protein